LARRAAWLIPLLTEGDLRLECVADDELDRDPAASLRRPGFSTDVAEALYWLWRCFFLEEEDRLAAILDRLAPVEARLLKDAATLVRELRAGRVPELPGMGNVAALRRRVAVELPAAVRARLAAARERRRASLRSPSGVTLEPVDEPVPAASATAPLRTRDGGRLEATGDVLRYTPAGGPARELHRFVGPESTWFSLHPDEDRVLVPSPHAVEEVTIATGARARAFEAATLARYLPDGRVIALKTVDVLLYDRRQGVDGARLLGRAHGGDLTAAKEMVLSADGRFVVCFSPRPKDHDYQRSGPAPARVLAVIDSSLVPLATFALKGFAVERVVEREGRLTLVTNRGEVFVLAGLPEALARDRAAYESQRQAALDRAARGPEVVLVSDRARPAPPPVDYPEVLEGVPHRLELRYESGPRASGYRLALVNGSGQRRPVGPADELLPQAQVRLLSPDRRHALVGSRWRLVQVDLASGRQKEVLVCALNAAAYLTDGLVLVGDLGITAARRRFPDPGPDGRTLDVFGRSDLAADPTLHIVDLQADPPAITALACFVLTLSTVLGGRIAVVSRFAAKGWNTAILGVKDRRLVVLAKLQEELGAVFEHQGRVYTEHGEEILNLDTALSAAPVPEGLPDL